MCGNLIAKRFTYIVIVESALKRYERKLICNPASLIGHPLLSLIWHQGRDFVAL